MREWLIAATEAIIDIVDAMALLVIAIASLIAFAHAVRTLFAPPPPHERRAMWIQYGRWLVAGLTFQLAADIIESSIATNWEAIGRLGAIAVIRTFLNYFLERDLQELRERQEPPASAA